MIYQKINCRRSFADTFAIAKVLANSENEIEDENEYENEIEKGGAGGKGDFHLSKKN